MHVKRHFISQKPLRYEIFKNDQLMYEVTHQYKGKKLLSVTLLNSLDNMILNTWQVIYDDYGRMRLSE